MTWKLTIIASVSALAMSTAGYAQEAQSNAQQAQGNAQQAAQGADAGDIVVTANKREQSLADVGSSVVALGGEALRTQRVSNVADLAQVTPGLTFAPSQNATPVYTIRGVGFFESTLAAYPDVSLYLDQVPLPLPVMSTLTAFDLERVEVLKGPQGTLFGNNATGGAINFVAARPTKTFSAGADLGYGRFNTFEYSGFISGPITDTLRARLAVKGANGNEWQRSYTRVDGGVSAENLALGVPPSPNNRQDRLGKTDNIAGRLIVDWDPTADIKLSLNLNAWRDQDDPIAPQHVFFAPQYALGTPGGGGGVPFDLPMSTYPTAPANARDADWTPQFRPYADNRFKQATFRGDFTFGGITLTSLTGYSNMHFRNATDGDGTALVSLDVVQDRGNLESFTQELRLSNGGHERLRWVLGANYEHTTVDEVSSVFFPDSTSTAVNGIVTAEYETTNRMNNYAIFGNVEYDVIDRVTLKAGIRQTKAKRAYTASNRDAVNASLVSNPNGPTVSDTDFFNGVYGFLGSAVFGQTIPTIAPGGSFILDTRVNPDGSPVNPSTFLVPGVVHDSLNEDSTSWSVGVDFKPLDTVLLYANISQGYKAGSFPHLSGAIYDAYAPVTQESLLDYEIGFKAQVADRRVSINGSMFYYDYKDKQLRAKFVDPIFGALDHLVNVPKSRVFGTELEVQARPLRGLSLTASGTYLDAKVREYNGVVGESVDPVSGLRTAVTASFRDVQLPFSPKFQYNVRADYEFPIGSALRGYLGGGVNGQTKSVATLVLPGTSPFGVPSDLFKVDGRALVNLNAGIGSEDNRWRFMVWGKNVFNDYYWTNALQAFDNVVRYPGRPAEYGVAMSLRF
jgi:outer membrane receptor protein involved in Fe transport